jgi:TonB family protein
MRKILLALALCSGMAAQSGAPCDSPQQASGVAAATNDALKQWEYKTVHPDADLNELVSQGWEFVTMSSDDHNEHYLLKRIKPDPPKAQAPTRSAQGSPVYKAGADVLRPVLFRKIEPTYTPEAEAMRIQGIVVLYLEVTPGGFADNIRIARSLDPGLDQRTIEAVRLWRFRPGTKDGKPVRVPATVEVNFQLF